MSGLEPVAALGLACNILQVIEVGLNTIRVAKRVYKDGALDPALTESASALESISSRILGATAATTTISATSTSTTSTSTRAGAARAKSLDKQLSELADKCQGAARDLREEVNFLNGHPTRAKLVATLKITAKTTWRKRRLEKLEGKLKDAQVLLQTSLLARVDEKLEKSNSDLSCLDATLKLFIDEYRNGKTDIRKLIATEAAHAKAHITAETAKSEKAVKDHVTETSDQLGRSLRNDINLVVRSAAQRDDDAGLAARRERLLRSLKFDRMNERRNQVTPSHSGTFSWVLRDGSDGNSSSDGDSSSDSTGASVQDVSWDIYSDWLRSTAPAYWISGKPGSGKTTLMKYLFNHDLTRTFLDVWKSGVVLVSHFFWRPGTEMQQSIKGMLCSLLHQLLLKEAQFTDQLLRGAKFAAALDKDHETDWSSEELLATFREVLSHYPRPVAIFLDGLDEVHPKDGALRLLDVIEELRQLDPQTQRLKMCLGSRREPLFQRRLCSFPQLRLEQVNFPDLQKYGMDNIKVPPDYHSTILRHDWEKCDTRYFFQGKTPPSCDVFRDWLVSELLDKAEGVFLWLCLTVKAIAKAIHQGETVEDLKHRIRTLPTDLEDLYADMWARTGAESALIRKRAGSYFQLAMAGGLVVATDIFYFMIATTPIISARFLAFETKGIAPAASLINACEATKRDIEIACAGLLVCSSPIDTAAGELEWMIRGSLLVPWHGEEYDMLIPYMKPGVSFLHRTAKDFLTDTEAGRRILACGSFPETLPSNKQIESRLAKSIIMGGSISNRREALAPCELTFILQRIALLGDESHEYHDSMSVTRLQLLRLCEQVFNTGRLRTDAIVPPHCFDPIQQADRSWRMARQTTVRRHHEFLLRAVRMHKGYPGINWIWSEILKAVTSRNVDDDTISELLVWACSPRLQPGLDCYDFRLVIEKLLDLGASPVWNGPLPLDVSNLVEFTAHTTAFKELTLSIWDWSLNNGVQDDPQKLLQLIPLFISHGSRLEEEVYIAVSFPDKHIRFARIGEDYVLTNPPLKPPPPWTLYNTVLIIAYPAAALLANAIHIWGLGDASRVNGLSQAPEMAKIRWEQGQLIAVVVTRTYAGSPAIFETPNIYPVASGTKLDENLVRLMEVVERKLTDYEPRKKRKKRQMMKADIPLEVQQGVIRAVKRMRSENVSAADRIREFRERVGICTPFEEWLEHDKWPLWDEEWDEDRVNIRPKKGMEEVMEGGEGAGEERDDGGDDATG